MMTLALFTISMSMNSLNCVATDSGRDSSSHLEVMNCPGLDTDMPHFWRITLVLSLMLYVSGYQVGFGPVSWIMISEVFPQHVRSSAISVTVIFNFGTNIIVTASQPTLLNVLGASGLFLLYTVLSVLSFFFVWCIVPETRGKTLEEITAELSRVDAELIVKK